MKTETKVSLKDIASRADVSVAAVSMALADHPRISLETRRRVQKLSQELGYRPPRLNRRNGAERPAGPKLSRMGFVLVGSRLDDEVHAPVVHEFSQLAKQRDARLEVHAINPERRPIAGDDQRDALVAELVQFARGFDGVILSGQVEAAMLDRLATIGVRCVVLGGIPSDQPQPRYPAHVISTDFLAMGHAATDRLLALGAKKVGFVGEVRIPGLSTDRVRAGYHLALLDAGIRPEFDCQHIVNRKLAGGGEAARYFAAMGQARPDAFVVVDVRVAGSFAAEMAQQGVSVPEPMLVVVGSQAVVQRYQMQRYCLVSSSPQFETRAAVDMLEQLLARPDFVASRLVLPHVVIPPQ